MTTLAEPPSTSWEFRAYDRDTVDRVWELGVPVPGNDPALWRKDQFGAWIHRLDFGRRHSEFGWEIHDLSIGGSTTGFSALRPVQWQNLLDLLANETRSRVTADGLRNARRLL
jgi:hypothetical protein